MSPFSYEDLVQSAVQCTSGNVQICCMGARFNRGKCFENGTVFRRRADQVGGNVHIALGHSEVKDGKHVHEFNLRDVSHLIDRSLLNYV